MARNEEKQQGRLNRLWLQREREEGRLKDVNQRRPRLSSLNSASSVKKWIPSIKNEIEYYLQQSQLTHYPERKIAEFQLHIEALEREYKSFIRKLRVLDPSCKHKPWTPRAYLKRRADTPDSASIGKTSRPGGSHGGTGPWSGGGREPVSSRTRCFEPSSSEGPLSFSETGFQTLVPTEPVSQNSEAADQDHQDQPLSFDRTRLAVAAAAFRGPSAHLSSSRTHSLARVLQSGLPNLQNSFNNSTLSPQNRDTDRGVKTSGTVQQNNSDCESAERKPETSEERSGHVLGLDCYSSSDEDT